MNRFKQIGLVLATVGVLSSGLAQAGLESRAGGTMVYDNVLNITWLANANQGAGSSFDDGSPTSDGRMTWQNAVKWADNLNYGGYTDWRLPTALNQDGTGPCYGYSCNSSEMGHLFSTDGELISGQSITTSATLNSYFTNMQSGLYWSGTAYAPNPASFTWGFYTSFGYQDFNFQNYEYYAWAVRPGDVAAPIPEPETYAMLLAGLGLLGVVAKRKKSA